MGAPAQVLLGTGGIPSLYNALISAGLGANLGYVLDPGDSASYSGAGQQWNDESPGGFFFYRGTDNTVQPVDPTFNGTPGTFAGQYWSTDGTQLFTYHTTNEAFMQTWHKTGANFGMYAFIYRTSTPAALSPILADLNFAGAGGPGIYWEVNSAGKILMQVNNAAASAALVKTTDAVISLNAWHFVGLSINEAGGAGSGFLYKDGAYDQVGSSNTFNAAYTSPSAASAESTLTFMSDGGQSFLFENGWRMGPMAVTTTAPTKAQMDAVFAQMRSRYGI